MSNTYQHLAVPNAQVCIYNMPPELPPSLPAQQPLLGGARVAIVEPFFTRLGDGTLAIRVDHPKEVRSPQALHADPCVSIQSTTGISCVLRCCSIACTHSAVGGLCTCCDGPVLVELVSCGCRWVLGLGTQPCFLKQCTRKRASSSLCALTHLGTCGA
jgi:hypothetical protein